MPILSGSSGQTDEKQSLRKKYLEVFQLTIRPRSGVCRNSWSRLLAEFHFNTFEEASPPSGTIFLMPGNDAVQELAPENYVV